MRRQFLLERREPRAIGVAHGLELLPKLVELLAHLLPVPLVPLAPAAGACAAAGSDSPSTPPAHVTTRTALTIENVEATCTSRR